MILLGIKSQEVYICNNRLLKCVTSFHFVLMLHAGMQELTEQACMHVVSRDTGFQDQQALRTRK